MKIGLSILNSSIEMTIYKHIYIYIYIYIYVCIISYHITSFYIDTYIFDVLENISGSIPLPLNTS